MIPNFGHHQIPLLPDPGAAGALGSKAHLAAVKTACKSAERIDGVLTLAGRFEVAVVPDSPDFFDRDTGVAKARGIAWETMRLTQHLQWIIPTRHPENISKLLPSTWIGKGFRNVCVGVVVDGEYGLSEKLQALRKAPLQYRMILVMPSAESIDLRGQLDGIDWVVFVGSSANSDEAALVAGPCQDQHVVFHFHQTDGNPDDEISSTMDHDPPWLEHPFGTKIQLSRPTLTDLKAQIPAILEFQTSPPNAPTKPEAPVTPSVPVEPTTTNESPALPPPIDLVSATQSVSGKLEIITSDSLDTPVSNIDRQDFDRLDGIVREGLQWFTSAGNALSEIRSRELWKAGCYDSWASYCTSVCRISKTQANRLISAAEVMEHLKQVAPIGVTQEFTPRNESQVRPLCRLKAPEHQAAAWTRAYEQAGGQPTAEVVRDIVAELMADDAPPAKSKPDRKQQLTSAFSRLREELMKTNPSDKLESLITELEKLLKLA